MKTFYNKIIITNRNLSITLRLSNVSIEEDFDGFVVTQENMNPIHQFSLKYADFSWKPIVDEKLN